MQQTGTEQSFRWVRRDMLALLLGVAIVPGCFRVAEAATAVEINKDADAAIKQLEAQDRITGRFCKRHWGSDLPEDH